MSVDDFLKKILQLESSGGKDVEHKRMTAGIHKGEAAMGGYGIMPKTAEEFIERRRRKGRFGPDENLMSQMTPEQLKAFLQDQPRVEENLAKDIAEHVLKKTGGNEEKAAYMWNMGHNLPLERVTDEKLEKSPYVGKFRRLKETVTKKGIIP